MKKLVVLSSSDIDYVQSVARTVSDPRAKNGDFSKGLRKVIAEHRENAAIKIHKP
jgi:hypothetical protein